MKINNPCFSASLLSIAISIALTSTAVANNINAFSISPPTGVDDIVTINNGENITLSATENTGDGWNNFKSLRVGESSDGSRNIGELKMCVEGQLSSRLQLWGNVAQQIGDNGYSDTQGMLGMKYSF